ncbi:MAG: bifunctional oligoribonuclease/PAP phosphatase NrnA [Christensenellaceae bacterium]|jgi:phosphoesterase RecJ-like protein|nr:bifunctional oligoribonuclease/PAP phosphatase NrnA [Christensenellaceae bacterium]
MPRKTKSNVIKLQEAGKCAEIVEAIFDASSVGLFAHVSPDGDTLGSCQALKIALTNMGKRAHIYCDGIVPFNFRFLDVKLEEDDSLIPTLDLCIIVDSNVRSQLGKYADILEDAQKLMGIDHHANVGDEYKVATKGYFDDKSASCAELVYDIIDEIGLGLDKNIAASLYAGVADDTGGFRHPNTTGNCFKVAGICADAGINLAQINHNIFKMKPSGQIGYYKNIVKRMKLFLDGKLIVVDINNKLYNRFKYNCEATEIFDLLVGVAGVGVAIKVTEKKPGVWNIGFRSTKVNVAKLAAKFGGGGHTLAAGARFEGKYKVLLKKILSECKAVL